MRVTIFSTGRKCFDFYVVTRSYSSRPFLCALGDSYPLLGMVSYAIYLVPLFILLFWARCTHGQLNLFYYPFYHPFHLDVTHVRLYVPGSPNFSVLQVTESWAGPGNEATFSTHKRKGTGRKFYHSPSPTYTPSPILCNLLDMPFLYGTPCLCLSHAG